MLIFSFFVTYFLLGWLSGSQGDKDGGCKLLLTVAQQELRLYGAAPQQTSIFTILVVWRVPIQN
jgi:hypothetical protein